MLGQALCIISFNPHNNLEGGYNYPCFTDEETENQRGAITCSSYTVSGRAEMQTLVDLSPKSS